MTAVAMMDCRREPFSTSAAGLSPVPCSLAREGRSGFEASPAPRNMGKAAAAGQEVGEGEGRGHTFEYGGAGGFLPALETLKKSSSLPQCSLSTLVAMGRRLGMEVHTWNMVGSPTPLCQILDPPLFDSLYLLRL